MKKAAKAIKMTGIINFHFSCRIFLFISLKNIYSYKIHKYHPFNKFYEQDPLILITPSFCRASFSNLATGFCDWKQISYVMPL